MPINKNNPNRDSVDLLHRPEDGFTKLINPECFYLPVLHLKKPG